MIKHWSALSRKHQLRTSQKLWENVQDFAKNETMDVKSMCEFLLTRCEEKNKTLKLKIPTVTAAAICNESNFDRMTYTQQRKMLKANSIDVLPSWNEIQLFRNSITPLTTSYLPDPFVGVYASFIESIKITIERILRLEGISVSSRKNSLTLEVKFGYDGSGEHKIYNQLHNVNTSNIIMAMFFVHLKF
nr:uncharacterized protein LOC124809726 [Hydra vulgaris]